LNSSNAIPSAAAALQNPDGCRIQTGIQTGAVLIDAEDLAEGAGADFDVRGRRVAADGR
jgi:hypothetical protein